MKELFEQYPGFDSIVITGYVPYFADGDPCVFHLSGTDLLVNKSFAGKEEENDYYYDDDDGDDYDDNLIKLHVDSWDKLNTKYSNEAHGRVNIEEETEWARFANDINALVEFFESNEDVLNELYGDHFQVTISRDGIVNDEYTDHD